PRILPGLAPHAPFTTSRKTYEAVANFAKENSIGIMTHISETKKENDDIQREHKLTPFQFVDSSGLFEKAAFTIAAHCVWLTEDDYRLMKKYPRVTGALNPQCNAKLASGISPVAKFLKSNL